MDFAVGDMPGAQCSAAQLRQAKNTIVRDLLIGVERAPPGRGGG